MTLSSINARASAMRYDTTFLIHRERKLFVKALFACTIVTRYPTNKCNKLVYALIKAAALTKLK